MVFANPQVARRVTQEFIPVALKAAMVNNPPPGIEGALLAEIGRSKPAPQGICTANSDGKVLAWALSFDDEPSILKFLDHAIDRFRRHPDAKNAVPAQRYRRYPSAKMSDVEDNLVGNLIPTRHADGDPCPAAPKVEAGTLVGTVIGRALDSSGKPIADTTRQERYMEAHLRMDPDVQSQLADAAAAASGKPFRIPDRVARAIVGPAFLGQLDVGPLGNQPGSRNSQQWWELYGEHVVTPDLGRTNPPDAIRIRVGGSSHVMGEHSSRGNLLDGRNWNHRVTLRWQGFIELRGRRISRLVLLADGSERLLWQNRAFDIPGVEEVTQLMAGHAIDFDGGVRYGLMASAPDEAPTPSTKRRARESAPAARD